LGKHGRYTSTHTRDLTTQEIINQIYVLLPFTFDPGGQIGPLATTFLWPNSNRPTTSTQSSNCSTTHILNHSTADQLFQTSTSTSSYSNFGLLRKADLGWKKEHQNIWFTRSYTATLPSQWTSQVLRQNFTIASAKHIQTSISHISNQHTTSKHNRLNTATIIPRYMHSTYALSSAFNIASALLC
jgi:hypothetical protein